MAQNKNNLKWSVNAPQLLQEISLNKDLWVLNKPLNIFQSILGELAKRAIEIDDKELNKIMIRLSLYDISNPQSKDFNQQQINEYLNS